MQGDEPGSARGRIDRVVDPGVQDDSEIRGQIACQFRPVRQQSFDCPGRRMHKGPIPVVGGMHEHKRHGKVG